MPQKPIHIKAEPNAIASSVIITGDPTRAEYMAENFLTDVVCYSSVRHEPGFTGLYEGRRVSIQSVGIGMPSMRTYIKELLYYGVSRIIRVGTCGSLQKKVRVGEFIMAQGGCSDSAMNLNRFGFLQYAPIPDWDLMLRAYNLATERKMHLHVGNVLGTDKFHPDSLPPGWQKPPEWELFAHYGVIGVEMETPELYTLGKELHFKALTLLTVSDNLARNEKSLSAKQRTKAPRDLVTLALDVI